MKKTLIIILTLSLQSCMLTSIKPTSKQFEYKKILSETTKSYVYRARIKLYDNDFSGLIIFKPQTDGHRIVFINEIGMKFFDIELLKDTFKVHQIFEAMNKKLFIKLLVSDFKFILMYPLNGRSEYYSDKETNQIVLKPKKVKFLYYFDNQTRLPEDAVKYSLLRKNTFLAYSNYKNEIPQQININHKNIKFAMNLSFLK